MANKEYLCVCGVCGLRFTVMAGFISASQEKVDPNTGLQMPILSGACPNRHTRDQVRQAWMDGFPVLSSEDPDTRATSEMAARAGQDMIRSLVSDDQEPPGLPF
ncbi:hypothetical protein LCGC14_1099270 [marine sediment metagenome]|uniref:Uncharacterized protein n=1 Tax=marine sediment metagenome TaxID=412755 RepID=A0A0F9MEK1_9ZZZZ